MLKPNEMKESLLTNRSTNDVMKALTEFVKLKNGAVLCKTKDHIKAKFGSKFIARFFGIPFLRIFKKTLPFYLDVRVHIQQEMRKVDICLSDNLGLCLRLPLLKSVWQVFFSDIMQELKKAIQPVRLVSSE